jgi:hypothetical protein
MRQVVRRSWRKLQVIIESHCAGAALTSVLASGVSTAAKMSEAKLAETVRLLETAWTTALGVWSAEADLFSKARQGALGVPSVVGLKGCPGQAVHAPAATANCAKTYSVLSALCGAALPTALAERSIS